VDWAVGVVVERMCDRLIEEWIVDAGSMLDDQPAEGFAVTVVTELGDETMANVTGGE